MLVPALILVVKYALVAALVGVITFLFYQLAKPSSLKKDSAELPAEQAHKLIRQGYARSKLPEKLDAIVIGSGIGGLMPAVFLAKAGWKVLVLEQHDVLGGTTHTFEEGGYHFDSGVHYVGGDVGVKGSQLNRLFSLLTDGRLEWADICNNDKQCYDNLVVDREKFSFPMRKGEDNLRGDLYKRFPEQKDHDAIDRYFALVKRLELEAGAYFSPRVMPTLLARLVQMLPWYKHYAEHMTRSFDDVMDGITDNRELRAVLCYLYGDYGLPPSRAPFALHAMVATHYFTGAYYPSGGCNKIAEYATQIIEKHGGKAFVRSPVGSLLVDDAGRVTGVRLERNGDEIQAPVVISACGAYNTFAKLLPEERRSVVQQPIEEMKKLSAPTTHLNLFVGLDQTASQLKLPSYNTWNIPTFEVNKVNDEWIDCKTLEDVFKPRADGSAPGIPCFIGFPAAKDPRRAEEKACAEVICEARYSWFEQWKDRPVKHRGQDYEQWKQKLTDALLERLYALYPQTRGHVVFSSLGTPLTNEYYLGSEGGGSYGLAHVIDRWKIDWLRPETPFPGLYLSGQDVCSCGLAGAMMGGFMCTMAVSKAAFFGNLHNLK